MAKIAFFGLGNMGAPMVENLIRADHELSVYDPFPSACSPFDRPGVKVAQTPVDAIANAEFVISMLPAGSHVKALYLGEDDAPGILSQLSRDCILIDSSTIDVDSVKAVYQGAQQRGITMMDAPVSGGVSAAKAGTLTFMCGASASLFEKAKPILAAMGKNIFRAGDSGAGQIAKMCNNMLLAIHMAGTAEALKLGLNNNLDPKVLSDIMQQSSGNNWSLERYNPAPGVMENAPASHDFQAGFTVNLMLKDLGLALDNSVATHSATPMGALARSLYASHQRRYPDNGTLDFSSIWQMF